jgi:hypothetical protein
MSEIVPADEIEKIVGVHRHMTRHVGRAVEAEQTVYILHSHECKDSGIDLRECPFSLALDEGINPPQWVTARATELPVMLEVIGGRLVPTGGAR